MIQTLLHGPVAPAGRKNVGCKPNVRLNYVQTPDKYLHLMHHLKLQPGAGTLSLDNARPCRHILPHWEWHSYTVSTLDTTHSVWTKCKFIMRATGLNYLVIIVIQIRICALKLHHLDSGNPFFFSLHHQIAIGVSVFPFQNPSPAEVIPEDTRRREKLIQAFYSDALSWSVDGTHPVPLFCILRFSILRCCGWRWVVLCLMGIWPRCGPWGPILGPDCPKKGRNPPTPPCNNGGGVQRWNWPTKGEPRS